MEKLNIYQRLSAITDELGVVAKALEVSTGQGKGYKAVSERDVIDAVKPLERKYGIYSYPTFREVVDRKELEVESKYGTKVQFFTRVLTTYRFVNVDNPSEYVETTTYAEGIDSGDKGAGKAMTYSDKYALMKMYKMSTGEDLDAKASEEMHVTPMATEQEKKFLKDVAKDMGYSIMELLTKAGWSEGTQLTKEQYSKAMLILKEKSDEINP